LDTRAEISNRTPLPNSDKDLPLVDLTLLD